MAMNKCDIEFIELEKSNVKGYTLIEGFPGVGLVGTIASKYLVEKLDFKEIGHIKCGLFLPIVRVHEGTPVYPSRIYMSEKQKLVVLIAEQVIPVKATEALAEKVIDWVKLKGISSVISLAGINVGADSTPGKKTVFGIASNDASKKFLETHGIEPIREGITAGITALMLLELKKENILAFSLLGSATIAADYKAAAVLIEKLNEIFGLNINVEPLLMEAKETETEILQHMQRLKETRESVEKFQSDQTPMTT